MKKILFCFLIYICQLTCAANHNVKKNEKLETISIASLEIPPYAMPAEKKQVRGILVELIRFVAAEAKLNTRFVILPWSRALEETQYGRYDGIIPTIRNKERESIFNFSAPLTSFELSLFGLQGHKKFNGDFKELNNQILARVQNQSGGPFFDSHIRDNAVMVLETNSFQQSIDCVNSQRANFALLPKLVGLYLRRQQQGSPSIEPSMRPVGKIDMQVAFTKVQSQKSILYDKFNQTLEKLIANGKLQAKERELIKAYGF